ncbi:MAG: carboxypeptidase-like regulatory domain-containing protein [Cyclobacteriaceae bacterium]|nr:carboxypeptidase-like regulatory domain-containing protein [Cyclobacteriaceae bacterium]
MIRFQFVLPILFMSVLGYSQSGTIKGTLRDETTGDGLIGANILIEGTGTGSSTDIEGNFIIPKVKAGTYNLVLTSISYASKTIAVNVYPDQTTVVSSSLKEDVQELEGVLVTGKRQTNTDVSVISELKKADLVAVGISSQQIRMSQDRDAAQVIRRVPGVTIVGNRFINVRGLSERYSTVMLNGIIAPSTEVDSKAFSFDLIPSSMLDRMLVFKSGSAELPGEMAGAIVNIHTKNMVEENAMSLSVSGSFRNGTTGKSAALGQGKGSLDWFGKDDGTRALPAAFPSQNLRIFSQNPSDQNISSLINATNLLPNFWGSRSVTAMPDFRVNFDLARVGKLGTKKLENISSLSYSTTNQVIENEQNYYDFFDEAAQKSPARYQFHDVRFTQTNRIGALSNFTLELSPLHRIEFRNFYNQQGQNQSTFRTGIENAQGFEVKNQSFNYNERSIYSSQLSGKHSLSDAINVNWIFGYNTTNANQPDYRRIRSQRSSGSTDGFSIVIPPGASSFDAGRFYSELNEQTISATGNIEWKLNPAMEENRQTKVTAGYYVEQKNRAFDARWLSYKWLNPSVIDNSLLLRSFDQLFVPENLGTRFILEEGTNEGPDLYDKYDGNNRLIAGYVGMVTPFADKFRLSAGMRVENNVQQIDVYDPNGLKKRVTDSPVTVPMPFFNLSYNMTEKMLVRIAYSKTVNRPVFRELAPFNYYDFDRNADIVGNPDLKTAQIDNIDLRWEMYPSNAEFISLGVFYKHFKNPIEQYLSPGSNLRYGYTNADQATNYGVEAELRKSLEGATGSNFMNKLTFVFNGALIKSKIELPASLDNLDMDRAMQGQSPYVVNTSLYYNDFSHGLQMSVQYNVFGKRIYAVGDKDLNPSQYEMARNQIDLTITKTVSQHFELKFGIQDLLNQRYRLVQDSNRDKKITQVDEPIQTFRTGQYSTLGIVWKF